MLVAVIVFFMFCATRHRDILVTVDSASRRSEIQVAVERCKSPQRDASRRREMRVAVEGWAGGGGRGEEKELEKYGAGAWGVMRVRYGQIGQ